MKAKIEIVNFRRLVNTSSESSDIQVEHTVKHVAMAGEGDFIDFHSVEPFNKNEIAREYFIIKNITSEYIEFFVKNCESTKFLLEKELKQTTEDETIILGLNQTMLMDDSFSGVYNTTTIRVVEVIGQPTTSIVEQE